jgi:ankyrin repeat protein
MGKKGSFKKSPIFAAVDNDDAEEVTILFGESPSVLAERNSDGWTPLISAAFSGSTSCVTKLIALGADVKAVCKDGDSAVHYASAQGYADLITILSKAGASLTLLDNDGESPIDVAANAKVKKVIEKLIMEESTKEEGVDEKPKDGGGEDDDDEGNFDDEGEEKGDGSGAPPPIRFGSKKTTRR